MPWGGEDREKTEPATGKKRDDARRKGQVAVSQELSGSGILLAGIIFLFFMGGALLEAFRGVLVQCFTENLVTVRGKEQMLKEMGDLFLGTFRLCFPLYAGVFFTAILLNLSQTGVVLASEKFKLEFGKLNPIKGVQNLLSLRALVKLLFSVLKLILIGAIFAFTVYQKLPVLLSLQEKAFVDILTTTASLFFLVLFRVGVAFLMVAIADIAYQRWQHEKELMMTKEEVKEEMKRTEGDPTIRRRVRQIQRERAMKRMLDDVSKAKVIVTNPTRYAVALAYEKEGMETPTVVAKGMNLVADRIKEVAFRHDIPIVENKPLARALYRTVEVGSEIPPALYRAVAEVLSYVYRLRGRL